ncbi:hypothetical protein DFQ28_006274 [Apophysomyces sp. BC1034]|nr:hypothetical protein DFQ30_001342 [Apophysomyces sp. BC1015]KAG0187496.1 hypothetical protein DFQ28_006274 [Apophysomyces sp. BC1034]
MIHDIASLSAESKTKMMDFVEIVPKLGEKISKVKNVFEPSGHSISLYADYPVGHIMDVDHHQYHHQYQYHQHPVYQPPDQHHHQHNGVIEEDIDMMDSDADLPPARTVPDPKQIDSIGAWSSQHAPSNYVGGRRLSSQDPWNDIESGLRPPRRSSSQDPWSEIESAPQAPRRSAPPSTAANWSSKAVVVEKGEDRSIWSSIHAPP